MSDLFFRQVTQCMHLKYGWLQSKKFSA